MKEDEWMKQLTIGYEMPQDWQAMNVPGQRLLRCTVRDGRRDALDLIGRMGSIGEECQLLRKAKSGVAQLPSWFVLDARFVRTVSNLLITYAVPN